MSLPFATEKIKQAISENGFQLEFKDLIDMMSHIIAEYVDITKFDPTYTYDKNIIRMEHIHLLNMNISRLMINIVTYYTYFESEDVKNKFEKINFVKPHERAFKILPRYNHDDIALLCYAIMKNIDIKYDNKRFEICKPEYEFVKRSLLKIFLQTNGELRKFIQSNMSIVTSSLPSKHIDAVLENIQRIKETFQYIAKHYNAIPGLDADELISVIKNFTEHRIVEVHPDIKKKSPHLYDFMERTFIFFHRMETVENKNIFYDTMVSDLIFTKGGNEIINIFIQRKDVISWYIEDDDELRNEMVDKLMSPYIKYTDIVNDLFENREYMHIIYYAMNIQSGNIESVSKKKIDFKINARYVGSFNASMKIFKANIFKYTCELFTKPIDYEYFISEENEEDIVENLNIILMMFKEFDIYTRIVYEFLKKIITSKITHFDNISNFRMLQRTIAKQFKLDMKSVYPITDVKNDLFLLFICVGNQIMQNDPIFYETVVTEDYRKMTSLFSQNTVNRYVSRYIEEDSSPKASKKSKGKKKASATAVSSSSEASSSKMNAIIPIMSEQEKKIESVLDIIKTTRADDHWSLHSYRERQTEHLEDSLEEITVYQMIFMCPPLTETLQRVNITNDIHVTGHKMFKKSDVTYCGTYLHATIVLSMEYLDEKQKTDGVSYLFELIRSKFMNIVNMKMVEKVSLHYGHTINSHKYKDTNYWMTFIPNSIISKEKISVAIDYNKAPLDLLNILDILYNTYKSFQRYMHNNNKDNMYDLFLKPSCHSKSFEKNISHMKWTS